MAFDKKLNGRLNRAAKKIYVINMLGGKCEHCGDSRFYIMNFHHDSIEFEKEFGVAAGCMSRLSELIVEAKKCMLLCANCHQRFHMDNSNQYEKRTNTKRILFEYLGTSACGCGESDSRILVFHHKKDKEFGISDWLRNKNITDVNKLPQKIKDELDKCVVLCHNCHLEEHLDKEFYDRYHDEILDMSTRIREITKPLDKELVKEMFLDGMKQIDIAKHFGSVKSTVSDILKSFNLTTPVAEKTYDRSLILKLHSEGKFNKEIMEIVGCGKNRLLGIFKSLEIKSNVDPDRNKSQRKFDPSPEELYKLLESNNYRQVGELFGVSYVAVLKRKQLFDKLKNK